MFGSLDFRDCYAVKSKPDFKALFPYDRYAIVELCDSGRLRLAEKRLVKFMTLIS